MNKIGVIYKVTNQKNGKVYIGQTINSLEYRFKQHYREARSERKLGKNNSRFHNALLKYSIEDFKKEVLEEVEKGRLNEREVYWISFFKSNDRRFGYNIGAGGGSASRSEEVRRKIGDKTRLRWENNPEQASLMREGLVKATEVWKEMNQAKRSIKFCLICGKLFEVANWNHKQKYCSVRCKREDTSSWLNYQKGVDCAREANIKKSQNTLREIKNISLDWALNNKEVVLNIPYNRISPNLKPLFEIIKENTGIVDARTIAKGICGKTSKKEMLSFLKDYVKMYAVPDQN